MVDISQITPVIVTRGDVNLSEIAMSLKGFGLTFVWNNAHGPNMGPLGQFLAGCYFQTMQILYFQDDDCVTDPAEIAKHWEPGRIVCNMGTSGHVENYRNRPDKLMGFGSVFERDLIKPTFEKYLKVHPFDRVLWREPGRIFTAINRHLVDVVEVPVRNLPWATRDDRLYMQPEHQSMGNEAIRRVMESC